MTFARYSRTLWSNEPAKVAKPAKVIRNQDVAVANPRLNPAKVSDQTSNLSQALAKLPPRKTAENLDFSHFSHFSRLAGAEDTDSGRSTLVSAWKDGVERLLRMPRPETYPARAWLPLIDDADQFMKRWATQAVRLGWQSWEVWGVHKEAPWWRIGGMGLVPSLQGRKIVALLADAAVVETGTGNRLRHYRRPSDPLPSVERALIWELA